MKPLIQLKNVSPLFLISFVFAWFALSPQARAVCREGCDFDLNTFLGDDAFISNTTGIRNTAIGVLALASNTEGRANTATGERALQVNTFGEFNTATGSAALGSNTIGEFNTATGVAALFSSTTGAFNTATGVQALFSNSTGGSNTATGYQALVSNTTGRANTATGLQALLSNTTGEFNTAHGDIALFSNTEGFNSTATGSAALGNNTTGTNNIALGNGAGQNLTTGSNNIDIGNQGVAGESRTIRIGTQGTQTKTCIAGISSAGVNGSAVKINAAGQVGTAPSAARFKDEIRPMDKASEGILALKPVTFRYKEHVDPERGPQFGLVAEDVARVNPDLVVRDAEGKVYTLRYEAVNAMLLNEFLNVHSKMEKQEATIAQLKKELQATAAHQQKQIEALTAGLQKVSAQLEASKPAPQVVNNP